MDEKNEEENNGMKFNEEGFDPTKEAFFSDLGNIEAEISSEALELVRHALSLIESHYYDDSIEVLRQAVGLYEQISKKAEIEALNRKISEIYILKEQNFRESEAESELVLESIDQKVSLELNKEELLNQANNLVQEGGLLLSSDNFELALDKYDEANKIFQNINREDDIERVNKLIEECYNKKAEFLRKKKETSSKVIFNVEPETQPTFSEEQIKIKRLKEFEEAKIREEQLSVQAFELLGQATELVRVHQYDPALELYQKSAGLFQEINWTNEFKKILDTIEQIKKEKVIYNAEIDRIKKAAELAEQEKKQKADAFIEKTRIDERTQLEAEAKKLREISQKQWEEEQFRSEIGDLVNKAERLAREYDINLKKAIKKGKLLEGCVYPDVINLYEDIRKRVIEKGWSEQAIIYTQQIKHYYDLLEKDKNLRKIEAQKQLKQKQFEELHKVRKEAKITELTIEKVKSMEESNRQQLVDIELKKQMEEFVNRAERMARDYDIAFKKAVKERNLNFESKYPKIIQLYTEAKTLAADKAWNEEFTIYSTQIKKYEELLNKEINVRKIEAKKLEERKLFEESYKIKEDTTIDAQKIKAYEIQKSREIEEEQFQKDINKQVDKAQKLAREYEAYIKKALKKGEPLEKSPYSDIIEIYSNIREKVYARGWVDQASIYANQIKLYEEKLEKDEKLREIEFQKIQKQREYEESLIVKKEGSLTGLDGTKLQEIDIKLKQEKEDEQFERGIDEMVDLAEKKAREYELAIKRGQFEKECPYIKISEIYDEIRKKVYAKAWYEEAEVYANQIKIYKEKFEKDQRLRQLEEEKIEKQRIYEESLKTSTDIKAFKYQSLEDVESKDTESEKLLNKAMNLISEAENDVRSYELSIKKDILILQSPYDKAISNYEQARKIFQKIGWNEEARRLVNTINFYKDKKTKDENLRISEKEKLEKEKLDAQKLKEVSGEFFVRERKIIDYEKIKDEEVKDTDEIFKLINKAERMAQEYEIKKKDDLLNIESPFEEIIDIYRIAKKKFEEVGWKEQADQLVNSIKHYKERLDADNKLRNFELEKVKKELIKLEKQKKEAQLAKEAEVELLKQKMQSLEIKKRQTQEYEAKKAQAFSFMDLAKRELNLNHFDKAIKYYKESENIFAEINWLEGMKLIKDSINLINRKREKYEQEQRYIKLREKERLKMEIQLEEQISKAQDLKRIQEEQKRKEFMEIQKQKEQEQEISERAYKLLEEGTQLKNAKKYDKAYEKYIMGRDLFQKLEWQHEVSRINNDLLFILKKEMKQTEKIKAMQQKKLEEEKELETLLKEAEIKREKLEEIRKVEKQKKVEKFIDEEMENANRIIRDLRYNEAILRLKRIIKKSGKIGKDKLVKQINKQIEILENASQVPLITLDDIDKNEDLVKYELAYKALDKAQLSLSDNQFMKAISELNEAKFNLNETKIGPKYMELINDKITNYKKELGIKVVSEEKELEEDIKEEEEDIRAKIALRRAERRKKIKELMKK